MPKWEGIVTWFINLCMFCATVYLSYTPLYEMLVVFAAYGWTPTIMYSYVCLFAAYYVFNFNTYPFIYAIMLRCREGSWPSTSKVWDSRACQSERSPRLCGGCQRLGRVAVWVLEFLTYTHAGSLVVSAIVKLTHTEDVGRSFDLERGEKVMVIEVETETPLVAL